MNILTPWNRFLLQKLIVTELVKSPLCSQEPGTGPYHELDESNPYPYTISVRSILILSYHIHLDHPSGLFPSGFLTKILCAGCEVAISVIN